ncbi:hypothetical protein, partial [Endozoicomonas sp. YOMI1]|uniref:hypothetical protein n=1 Tax=Endozoicomonas sp. YOMI1 TaxID=2828739 RepID=UPI0021497CF9
IFILNFSQSSLRALFSDSILGAVFPLGISFIKQTGGSHVEISKGPGNYNQIQGLFQTDYENNVLSRKSMKTVYLIRLVA